MGKTRFMIVAGFLGAGKTTSMMALTEHINANGGSAAIIANDLGAKYLVDRDYTAAAGLPVTEIAGDCICWVTEKLVNTLDHIHETRKTDIIMSDIPGCGIGALDNVYHKLNKEYPDQFELAPFTVIVDPERLRMIMPEKAQINLPEELVYLLGSQLEEADLIVLNKTDLLSAEDVERYMGFLKAACPNTPVYAFSAKEKTGIGPVAEFIMTHPAELKVVDVNYGGPAFIAAESKLSWYNRRVHVKTKDGLERDLNPFIDDLIEGVRTGLIENKRNVPHLKTFAAADGEGDFSKASLIGIDYDIEYARKLADNHNKMSVTINARAACEAPLMATIVDNALNEAAAAHDLDCRVFFTESFSVMDEGR